MAHEKATTPDQEHDIVQEDFSDESPTTLKNVGDTVSADPNVQPTAFNRPKAPQHTNSSASRVSRQMSEATTHSTQPAKRTRTNDGSAHSNQPNRRDGINATDWATVGAGSCQNGHPQSANPTSMDARWVDAEYRETNPWYGQKDKKPIFSLGRPLPRTVRWSQRRQQDREHERRRTGRTSKEDLAELGEMGADDEAAEMDHVDELEKRITTQSEVNRRTAEGVSHGDRYNDAGQPVFDYMPNDQGATLSRQGTGQSRRGDGDGPSYAIDSEPLGQREHDDVEMSSRDPNEFRNWWARLRAKHPEPLAEFLSTSVAVFIGLAGTLSVNLSANQSTQYGTYETSCWAWGFGWMFGIYLGGGVSGAHMNPAISTSLSLFRGFPWRQCLVYVLVQFIGSICAGALAWGVYSDTIRYVDPGLQQTAASFMSSPPDWVGTGTACFNQMVGSAIMMIAVFALGDDQNNPPGAGMHAFVLGLLVTTLKFTLGYNTGSALNPASDFGPRLIAYAVGYQTRDVFRNGWWIYGPWLATLAGSIIGCSIYDSFIFVGSESPINYRIPARYHERAKRMFGVKREF
ncbi:aquaporin-like protein [Xylariaceae sp. FL0016]|nr:aquaporin-like protein [Xylariaceae sp. FL0016]